MKPDLQKSTFLIHAVYQDFLWNALETTNRTAGGYKKEQLHCRRLRMTSSARNEQCQHQTGIKKPRLSAVFIKLIDD
ncbi:hypothetical protein CWC12_05870 [Pseudoalteromonas ruthenica]|nr:hypothetical protein CWC12_05870 [Pseudoalteromonas ruthenica]TMO94812.1 hypothetical protein CWC13_01215 [Pseudoalteromonas ruthenica]TMP08982.1 hypothetical protein CWC09_06565 [Pseudoalteromonas ruthenica]TMP12436.1 hypothetical protein CWC08_04530 [Pseudoalteromonas ruthenica]TMP24885.1 hypothetical protein CWC06_05455 [Pseudoalteromonas ruthenica]